MSNNRNCGPDIVKYFVVEPAKSTTTGFTVCDGYLYVNNITGCTGNVNINNIVFNGDGSVLFNSVVSACTGIYTSNLYGCSPINLHDDIIPINDNLINLGTPIKRFRDVNTISGTSTIWTSTNKVITPELDLGLDGLGNLRKITANNSIIQNDTLFGGSY